MNRFVELRELCHIEKGTTGITKAIPGDYPLVTTALERSSHKAYQFSEPSVLVPLVSSTGHGKASIKRIHYQEGKFALGTILAAIIPKNKKVLDAKYLYLYLSAHKDDLLVPLMKGAANVSLPITKLQNIKVPLPTIETQGKIINKYELLNTKIQSLSSLVAKQQLAIQKYKEQVLQDAIQGKLTEAWRIQNSPVFQIDRLRLPEDQEATIFEAPYEIPKSWVWARFKNITKVITCGMASTPQYLPEGKIFLSAKNVKPYRFMPADHKFVSEVTYQKIVQNAKPEINDILLTRVGAGIGEAALIDQDIDFAYYVSLTLIKLIHNLANPRFILHFLNSPLGIKNAIEHTTGKKSSQGNLNVNRVRTFLIPLPTILEQEAIVAKVDHLISLLDEIEYSSVINKEKTEELLHVILKEALESN